MDNTIALYVEIPEGLYDELQNIIDESSLDQDAAIVNALASWVMRRDQISDKQVIEAVAA